MMKDNKSRYVLKHLKVNHLKDTNCYLKYYSEINLNHYVFDIKEATHFETRNKANYMRRKFKHPELWQVRCVK